MKCLIWCAIREAELLENVALKATRSENSALLFFFFCETAGRFGPGVLWGEVGPFMPPEKDRSRRTRKTRKRRVATVRVKCQENMWWPRKKWTV